MQGQHRPDVRRFRVRVVGGFDLGREAVCEAGRLTVGTAEGVALRLSDPA
jgi:hypothetical protein